MKTQEKNKPIENKNIFKSLTWNGVPALFKGNRLEMTLRRSFVASLAGHVGGALLLWLIAAILFFFGLAPQLFPKPHPKDIEFIIKSDSTPRVHQAQASAPVSEVETSAAEAENKAVNETPSPASSQSPAANAGNKPKTSNQPRPGKAGGSSHSKDSIPDFAMPMPSFKSMSSGLGGSGRTRHSASGVESSSMGDFGGSSSAAKSSGGHSGFDKTTTRKIIATYDISPYVNELKRNVRFNWRAPKDGGNKRVELFLRIAKDGKIIILNVKKTSEVGEVDNAALNAVRKCVPLNPLPSKYAKSYLDVVFTFDASSIGSRY